MEDKARNNRLTDVTMLLDGGTTANLIRYGGGGNMDITNKGEPTAALLSAKANRWNESLLSHLFINSRNSLLELFRRWSCSGS